MVKMLCLMQVVACFTSFTMSGAQNISETTKFEEISEILKDNYIMPTKHTIINQNHQNGSKDLEDPWWDWCATFVLFSVLSICLVVGLLFIVSRFFRLNSKDVIKFSTQKTKDGWYSDNLLVNDKRIYDCFDLTEKDFIIVWS